MVPGAGGEGAFGRAPLPGHLIEGWTLSNYQDGSFDTKYGTIHVHNPGSFNVPNLQTYAQTKTRHVQLQGPALRAFKAAEDRIATKRKPHILITGAGYRSYELQRSLYAVDSSGRYADPDGSLHVEALAVDVDQGQGRLRLRAIHKALLAEGWFQAVEGEPWHYSFRLKG